MEKIAAVVVTYNRFNLVQKTIKALRNQTRKLDAIFIIDNDSTDGTSKWLDSQEDLIIIHQENSGGSGGFFTGMKAAYEKGFDWIWCMDDDVYPTIDCLQQLLSNKIDGVGIICPRRIMDGKPFRGECTKINLCHWNKPFHEELTPVSLYEQEFPFEIMGMAFEGPLINREVVRKIGYPNRELFILFDDTEYSLRAISNGFKVIVVPTAILEKEPINFNKNEVELRKSNAWKLFYEIRNNSFIHAQYGKNIFIRKIKPLKLLVKYDLIYLVNLFNNKYSFSNFISWHKAYLDGQKKKLGKK